ncbi:Lipid droplet-associated perilipin protein [Pleurotus pulmonarius]
MATMTETQTSTIPMPNGTESNPSEHPAPEITFIHRVASIPLVYSSLQTIHDTLASNAYTRTPFSTAKDISATAYKYTEPFQARFAPLIVRADGYANKAVDIVESRYPYPFQVKPEEVATFVRERRDSAVSVANKSFDEKVKSPAFNVAQGIDNRFAPIVDYIEAQVNGSEAGPSTPPDAKYQYQRALALSRTLTGRAYVYSGEQIKHLQTQSVLVNRAMETAHSISELASSSLSTAQTRVHTLSDSMVLELQKIQTSAQALSTSLAASASELQTSIRSQASAIPPQFHEQLAHLQGQVHELQTSLGATINELKGIVTAKDVPVQEKVTKITAEVKDRVTPLLAIVQARVTEILSGKKTGEDAHTNENGQPPTSNGNGNSVAE